MRTLSFYLKIIWETPMESKTVMALVCRWWVIHFANASHQRWRATFGELPTMAKILISSFVFICLS